MRVLPPFSPAARLRSSPDRPPKPRASPKPCALRPSVVRCASARRAVADLRSSLHASIPSRNRSPPMQQTLQAPPPTGSDTIESRVRCRTTTLPPRHAAWLAYEKAKGMVEAAGVEAESNQRSSKSSSGHLRSSSGQSRSKTTVVLLNSCSTISDPGQNRSTGGPSRSSAGQDFAPSVPPQQDQPETPYSPVTTPEGFLDVLKRWDQLPEAIRNAVLALVRS
jgi:hypothetical protein